MVVSIVYCLKAAYFIIKPPPAVHFKRRRRREETGRGQKEGKSVRDKLGISHNIFKL
jgi:hypothetical protein